MGGDGGEGGCEEHGYERRHMPYVPSPTMAYCPHMQRPFLALSLLLGACSILGFGCRERPLASISTPGQYYTEMPTTPPVPYVSKKTADSVTAKEVVEVRQILSNLAKTSSYHSLISVPGTNGDVKAEVLYSRTGGIQGTLQAVGGNSELYAQGGLIYARYATSSWQEISGSEEGQKALAQMKDSLFINEDGTSAFLIRDSATVKSVKDDPAGCKLYTFEQSFFLRKTTSKQTLDVCVKNSYPVRIKSTSEQGTITIVYDRFDDASILEKSPV